MEEAGENAPLDRAGSAERLVGEPTSRRGSTGYALKVAGLTTLACLLLASQVFVAFMVFDQRQQIQTLQKDSDKLSRQLHATQVAPIKMHGPMNHFPMMQAFVDLDSVATKAPVKQEEKKSDSVGVDEMIGLMEGNFEMPKFNDTILGNLKGLKKQLSQSDWKSFESWLRNWIIFKMSTTPTDCNIIHACSWRSKHKHSMASMGMKDPILMRDGEAVKVGIVVNAIPGQEYVFIHKDGQSLDYISKDEQLQRLSFDQAVTVENMQKIHRELLQPLTDCTCEGYSVSLLICGASMENFGTLIDDVIVQQVLTNVFSQVMPPVKDELFVSVSYLQFHPDGSVDDLLNPDTQTLELVPHPVLGSVIRGLGEVCVDSAKEAYTLYKTYREAQKAKEEFISTRCSWLFTVAVEWKLQEDEVAFQLCSSRLRVFGLVGGANWTTLMGVNPLLKVMDQIPSEATKTDPLLHCLLNDALRGNNRTALIYFIQPRGDLDDETPSALALAQKVKRLVTRASRFCWSPEKREQEIRGRIVELRHAMMSDAADGTCNIHRLAELIRSLQIVKEQSWQKKREASKRIKLKLCGSQKSQIHGGLSGGHNIHPKESSDAVKSLQEELRQAMEAHVREETGSVEKVQESVSRILQLMEALTEEPIKNIPAEKCDLCLQLNDEHQLEDCHAHERRRQLKELSGRLIQREVEKMERDFTREQLPSDGLQRELLVMSSERRVLVLQMEALRVEAQQAHKDLLELRHKHQNELRHLREESLQVFRRFHESSEDLRRTSEARYRSVLLEAVHDAIYLSAQNHQLHADNQQLRKALGELKDTLTKQGEHRACAIPPKTG